MLKWAAVLTRNCAVLASLPFLMTSAHASGGVHSASPAPADGSSDALVDVDNDVRADAGAVDASLDAGPSLDGAADGGPSVDVAVDRGGIFLPGTQPLELTRALRPPYVCRDCHGDFAEYDSDKSWKGTMMANAARDPLFHAALTVANQDEPVAGDLCIRCHSPVGWLAGRSEPARISNLEPDDFESVQCDFCHRLNPGPESKPYIGNGQYFVADDFTRRGPIRDALAPHDWQYSAYHEDSRLCGLCHDVSNPLRGGFAIERTYTEWQSSAFAQEGTNCQTCHMPSQRGFACGAPDMPERDVHVHELAGGNYWMPRVLAGEYPELGRAAEFESSAKSAEKKLKGSSDVTLQLPTRVTAGDKLSFSVRVENKTGHKLPTGYPEGRRMWLEVQIDDAKGTSVFHSGGYDLVSATRAVDPQLRTYEVRMAAQGVEGFHFILQDEVLQDNRIPPRGFVPRPDTRPVGRAYKMPGDGGVDGGDAVLAHWDDAPYELTLPKDLVGTIAVRATLWYQTTSREYIEALRDANTSDDYGRKMSDIWQRYDRAAPFEMAGAMGSIAIDLPPAEPETRAELAPDLPLEAGSRPEASSEAGRGDSGYGDDAGVGPTANDDEGCTCSLAATSTKPYAGGFGFSFGIIGLFWRWKARPRRRRFE